MKPLILISNDDGYQARGIQALADMVRPFADVIVCAPDGPRSGYSCAFSAAIPLTLTPQQEEPGLQVWSCNGTPVDSVKLALAELCPRRPDLVFGGINHGDNSSVNTHYSGTMGVTMEGCMKYIPSVAFSLCDHNLFADFEPLRPYVQLVTQRVLHDGLPKGVCLNVNFPDPTHLPPLSEAEAAERQQTPALGVFRGIRVCRMARGTWHSEVTRCHHPRGYDYWWMMGHYQNDEPQAEDTDRWALDHGYVSVVPERVDVTAHDAMASLRTMLKP